MKGATAISLILFLAIAGDPSFGKEPAKAAGPAMKKYVTEQATFVLYMPEGWKASEGDQGKFKTLFVDDPSGLYAAAMFYGSSPTGKDVLALASFFANNIRRQFIQVIPRQDRAQQIAQVHTSGPVTAEEFLYTFTSQSQWCKGYSFGISCGFCLNTNWSLWHTTVAAPADQ